MVDSPRLSPHKVDSLGRKRTNDSSPLRSRVSSRLGEPLLSNRSPNGIQSTLPQLLHQAQSVTSLNGVGQTNVQLHNAYYSVGPQLPSATKTSWSQARGSPHVLLSTGAKPVSSSAPGIIASPLQPGASLTRPPLKRDLLISDSRMAEQSGADGGGKCCLLM